MLEVAAQAFERLQLRGGLGQAGLGLGDFERLGAVGERAPGKYVSLKETIRGFKMICDGECDHLPEQAFYMVGGIDEAFKKAEDMGVKKAA